MSDCFNGTVLTLSLEDWSDSCTMSLTVPAPVLVRMEPRLSWALLRRDGKFYRHNGKIVQFTRKKDALHHLKLHRRYGAATVSRCAYGHVQERAP